ncbi:hypothetical protein F5878DRAFT_549376 [Lentinula raphanica]|uniref:Uncharacterized protein n=1 Tax=Lentinula raphanica TaxID=153919 RepID=A0AA38U4Q9_9AGAR|nr:hypothetical protein C8R42DRAFT_597972 [Lentinula raphanica]KAJ3831570.1 hypothetical protein F5878DRAFT_549376 [Lentinula raphanica]
MVDVCLAHEDEKGLDFWRWTLHLLDRAGHEFMSDEEDATILEESSSQRVASKLVKQVLLLKWRHPYFNNLCQFIDATIDIEATVFHRAGHASLERVRVTKESTWPPPPGRPKSFFSPVYLSSLQIYQKSALMFDEKDFPLRAFEGYTGT